jgi:hypothetical protein
LGDIVAAAVAMSPAAEVGGVAATGSALNTGHRGRAAASVAMKTLACLRKYRDSNELALNTRVYYLGCTRLGV